MNPLKGWQVDRSQIRTIGTGLQRPECILAQRDGSLLAADARGGVMRIEPDGSQRLIVPTRAEGAAAQDSFADRYVMAKGSLPNGLALMENGDILIANWGTDSVELLTAEGTLRTLYTEIDGRPIGKANFVMRDSKGRTWLTVTTQHGDEVARRLAEAGAQPFEEQKTLMSIELRDHPRASAEVETVGPLEYVKVVVDGVVAARGMTAIVGTDAVMHDIHTDPAFRRRGLGSVVMGTLAARAVDRGARTGLLMASTDGYHLYRKLGWSAEATMVTASGAPDPRPVGGDLGAVLTRG